MEHDPALLASLRRAVEAMPTDVGLRLHLATLLLEAGQRDEAIREAGAILQLDPVNAGALALVTGARAPAADQGDDQGAHPGFEAARPEFDWKAAESELADVLPPRFVSPDGAASSGADGSSGADDGAGQLDDLPFDVEHSTLRLADVAGMKEVKQRLEAAFLAPMRNPELRRLYGKSLRGGLLMYGPPGCGKTFIARAVAGELGARFLAVSFADIVDSMLGQSERNIHELFGLARRSAPCVVFLDEVDAIGQKRTQLRHTPMRAVVNQLLLELDDMTGSNEGVFVLAATNHPWDLDSALRLAGQIRPYPARAAARPAREGGDFPLPPA